MSSIFKSSLLAGGSQAIQAGCWKDHDVRPSQQDVRRSSCRASKHVITDKQVNVARKVFEKFDADHDGQMGADELHDALQYLGMRLTMKEARRLVSVLDFDGSGMLDISEFLHIMGRKAETSRKVTRIQSVARGRRTRRAMRHKHEQMKRHGAATKLQCMAGSGRQRKESK